MLKPLGNENILVYRYFCFCCFATRFGEPIEIFGLLDLLQLFGRFMFSWCQILGWKHNLIRSIVLHINIDFEV